MTFRGINGQERGQLVIEGILLMIVFTAAGLFVASQFRSRHLLADLVSGPWQMVAGMMECGSWNPPKVACTMHPNLLVRHLSVGGDKM